MDTKRSLVLSDNKETIIEKFRSLQNRKDIADLLDVDIKTLIYHLYRVPEEKKYKDFDIPKRHGGTRTISAPITSLKIIQRKFHFVLQCLYKPNNYIHSYREDRNVRSNALQHTQRKVILNIDLKEFFPSIHIGRVKGLFKHQPFNCNEVVAKTLAQICCHSSLLPQGAPTSPIISNMICEKMDKEIGQLVRRYGYTYTRYADDMSLSTLDDNFSNNILEVNQDGQLEIGKDLFEIISRNSFEINKEKIRIRNSNERQLVTGLVTNEFPNVRREYVRKIRAMLYAWKTFGLEAAESEYHNLYHNPAIQNPQRALPDYASVVRGKIEYLGMIRGKNDPIYVKFLRNLKEITPKAEKKEDEPKPQLDQNEKDRHKTPTSAMKVFISYCDDDGKKLAADAAIVLEERGHEAWYFDRDKSIGIIRAFDISDQIRIWCDKVLYLCTNGSISSTGQDKEIGQWDSTSKQIIVIPIDGAVVPNVIEPFVYLPFGSGSFTEELSAFVDNRWDATIRNWEKRFQKNKTTG